MTLKKFGVSALTAAMLSLTGSALAADAGSVISTQAGTNKAAQASQKQNRWLRG